MNNPYAPPPTDRPAPGAGADGADTPPTPQTPKGPRTPARPGSGRPHGAPVLGMRSRPVPPADGPSAPEPLPDPEVVARIGRLVRHFGLWLVAGVLVGMILPLPWRLASLVFLVGATVTGIRALRAVVRARVRGGLAGMLGLGLVLTVVLALGTLASLAFLPAALAQQDCLRGALTESAKAACQREYEDALRDLTGSPLP